MIEKLRQRSLGMAQVLGSLSIGWPQDKTFEKGRPRDWPEHFRLVEGPNCRTAPELIKAFHEKYGDKPKVLPFRFSMEGDTPEATQDLICNISKVRWTGKGIACRGDGKTAWEQIAQDGTIHPPEGIQRDCGEACPLFESDECQAKMTLKICLHQIAPLGVFCLNLGGETCSARSILSFIHDLHSFAQILRQPVAAIPLVLRYTMRKARPHVEDRKKPGSYVIYENRVPLVVIEYDPAFQEAAAKKLNERFMMIAGGAPDTPLLEGPKETGPEDPKTPVPASAPAQPAKDPAPIKTVSETGSQSSLVIDIPPAKAAEPKWETGTGPMPRQAKPKNDKPTQAELAALKDMLDMYPSVKPQVDAWKTAAGLKALSLMSKDQYAEVMDQVALWARNMKPAEPAHTTAISVETAPAEAPE